MKFINIPIGAYFRVKGYKPGAVYKKLSDVVIRLPDGSPSVAPPGDIDVYEQVEPLESFIRMTEEPALDAREDQRGASEARSDMSETRRGEPAPPGRELRLSLRPDDDIWAWPPGDDPSAEPPPVPGE